MSRSNLIRRRRVNNSTSPTLNLFLSLSDQCSLWSGVIWIGFLFRYRSEVRTSIYSFILACSLFSLLTLLESFNLPMRYRERNSMCCVFVRFYKLVSLSTFEVSQKANATYSHKIFKNNFYWLDETAKRADPRQQNLVLAWVFSCLLLFFFCCSMGFFLGFAPKQDFTRNVKIKVLWDEFPEGA